MDCTDSLILLDLEENSYLQLSLLYHRHVVQVVYNYCSMNLRLSLSKFNFQLILLVPQGYRSNTTFLEINHQYLSLLSIHRRPYIQNRTCVKFLQVIKVLSLLLLLQVQQLVFAIFLGLQFNFTGVL